MADYTTALDTENDALETVGGKGRSLARMASAGFAVPTVMSYDDYRQAEGVRTAFCTMVRNPMSGETVVEIDKIEKNVPIEETLFSSRAPGVGR